MKERYEILLKVLEQNYEHSRHVENERLWFTNIYAIIVGAILTLISKNSLIFVYSLIFCFILSILGFLMSLRLKADFEDFLNKIIMVAKELKVEDYVGIGAQKGITVNFKLRYIFPFFYLVMSVFFLILIIYFLPLQI